MIKPASLRAALVAALPALATDPDKLLVFIDQGSIASTFVAGASFEYSYVLNVILADYAGDTDLVMVPLLMWVRVNQSDLMDNPDRRADGITFEADILDNAKCDLSIKLRLTERVVVKPIGDGQLEITHPEEPQPDAKLTAEHWQLYIRDQLVAEWDVPPA